MIKMSDILNLISDAIERNSSINEILSRYPKHSTIFEGGSPLEFNQIDENSVSFFIMPAGVDEYGYVSGLRELNFKVAINLYNKELINDGILKKYTATEDLIDLLYYTAVALKEIATIGNHIVSAKATYDLDEWPAVKGILDVKIELPVGLNAEVEL